MTDEEKEGGKGKRGKARVQHGLNRRKDKTREQTHLLPRGRDKGLGEKRIGGGGWGENPKRGPALYLRIELPPLPRPLPTGGDS